MIPGYASLFDLSVSPLPVGASDNGMTEPNVEMIESPVAVTQFLKLRPYLLSGSWVKRGLKSRASGDARLFNPSIHVWPCTNNSFCV